MDEFLRNLLLVLCGLGALVLLVVAYLWYFVFGRKLRGVLMAGLSILLNRDSTIDLNADVVLEKRPEDVKNEMSQEVESLDFGSEIAESSQFVPKVEENDFSAFAVDSPMTQHELISSSFGEGRIRRMVNAVSRPFLRLRMQQPSKKAKAQNVQIGTDAKDD